MIVENLLNQITIVTKLIIVSTTKEIINQMASARIRLIIFFTAYYV